MLEGVTIEQLRTFRAVVEEGSFSAAARKLGRVQAAVSQSIDRLEAQLGLRLFDRSGRTPRLTKHGEAIASAAAKIEGEVDALDQVVESLKRGEETSLSIVVDYFFPTTSLVAFAKELAREHPAVELVISTEVLSAVTAQVRERRATWGVAIEDADMTDLERRPIADVCLVPVAASTFTARTEQDIVNAVQIVLSESVGSSTTTTAATTATDSDDHGVLSRRTWRVIDLATKHALIASGLGWGNMPEHLVRDDLASGKLVELKVLGAQREGDLKRSLLLVWRRGAVMGPIAKWAETRLSELCRNAVTHQSK